MKSHNGVVLYRTPDRMEASLIELELVRLGIPCVCSHGDGVSLMGPLSAEPFYVELWVPADRLADARTAVNELHASRRERDDGAFDED